MGINKSEFFTKARRYMQIPDEENIGTDQSVAAVGISKKMYYSISEVCAMTGIEPHILRYWEKEFSLLRPKKNSGGKRAYKEKDIEAILKIKRMLEEENYTLHGAKDKLLDERRERRVAEGNSTALKRRKADAASGVNGSESEDSFASIPTDTVPKLTKRKPAPKNNRNRRVNNSGVDNDRGNDNGNNCDGDNDKHGNGGALILSVRDELLGVLKLLE
jgi:DNA-binding transcriptional MerR regulator